MYARTTTVQADPSKIDDGIANIRDAVTPVITAMDGCVGMSMLADRASGRCIATSSWESEAALRDSADRVRPLRDAAEQALGVTTSTVDAWEIAVVHRDHAMPEGACARVTWLSGMADHAERASDVFRMAVLPRVQELDGTAAPVCSSAARPVVRWALSPLSAASNSRPAAMLLPPSAKQPAGTSERPSTTSQRWR